MQFTKTSAIIAAAAGLTSAAPTGMAARQSQELIPFTLQGTYMYADFLHIQNISASGLALNIGGDAATYCPGADVPCGQYLNQTVLTAAAGENEGIGMFTGVPGGQSLYVAENGEVVYTEAHSHVFPDGALQTVWTYTPGGSDSTTGRLTGGSHFNTIFACPSRSDENAPFLGTPWALYANVPGFMPPTGSVSSCVSVTLSTIQENNDNAGAWQYS